MSFAVRLGEDRKCSAAVVQPGSQGLSFMKGNGPGYKVGCSRFRFGVRVIYSTAVFIKLVF